MAFSFRRIEYVGIAAGAAAGSLIFGALPLAVGAAIVAFKHPASAGIGAALELVAMGVASIAVSARLRSLNGRQTALLSALALVIGHLLSAVAIARLDWNLFLAARLVAGLGEGALFTLCNAFASKAPRPDRAFMIVAFAQTIYNALFFTIMAFVNTRYDPVRTFELFIIFSAIAMLLILFVPPYKVTDDGEQDQAGVKTKFDPVVRRVLAGFAAYSVGLFILFPYVENIGTTRGFSHATVATVLAFTTVAAMLGPCIIAGIGLRFGRAIPIMIAIAFQITAAMVLVYSSNLFVWGAAELTSVMLLYILSPLMFGLVAHIDPSGRATAMATAIMAITAAAGPTISSLVLTLTSSYVALGWFNAGMYVLMAIIVYSPARLADGILAQRHSSPAPALAEGGGASA